MKLLVTLDFPPEIGGIQRYLSDIVRFTFSPEDRVLAGCSRSSARRTSIDRIRARIQWVSIPFSFLNKKFSCIPLLMHFIKLVWSAPQSHEVSCGNVYAAIVPWVASFFMPVRYAVYTHGTEIFFLRKRTARAWLLKKILKSATRLFSNSRYTESLLKQAGIDGEVTIIPPRVVIPPSKSEHAPVSHATEQTVESRIPQILCVGRLVPRKGFGAALDALALVPSGMEWQCMIVGDGPLGPALRARCVEKKINERVTFKNNLSDDELSVHYDRSSIFVLPGAEAGSVELGVEGFGIVLIEAMAHGVPVIAGRTGAVPEVLEDGACGILVEPGDVAALSREIRRLLGDQPLRRRLAAAALDRVKRCYAW
jgi:phosphatidyl-myo-inositol dimannoside synthase